MRNHNDKGSALVAAMVAVFVIAGMITAAFTLAFNASEEGDRQVEFATAMEDAQSGMDRAIAAVYKARIAGGVEGFSETSDSAFQAFGTTAAEDPYELYVRSYRRLGLTLDDPNNTFDIYEITSISKAVGPMGFRRSVQTVVRLPYASTPPANLSPEDLLREVFKSAMGFGAIPDLNSAAFSISGRDWTNDPPTSGLPAVSFPGGNPADVKKVARLDGMDEEGILLEDEDAVSGNVPPIDGIIELIKDNAPGENFNEGLGSEGPPPTYKFVHATGDVTLSSSANGHTGKGYGILFVEGNLHITGKYEHHGLIVVTGTIKNTGGGGNPHSPPEVVGVQGIAVVKQGGKVTGNADIQYNSAHVLASLAGNIDLADLATLLPPTVTHVGVPMRYGTRELDGGDIPAFLSTFNNGGQ